MFINQLIMKILFLIYIPIKVHGKLRRIDLRKYIALKRLLSDIFLYFFLY